MSSPASSSDDGKPVAAPKARELWVRPALTKMAAIDAELGTRPNVNDGAFSVS